MQIPFLTPNEIKTIYKLYKLENNEELEFYILQASKLVKRKINNPAIDINRDESLTPDQVEAIKDATLEYVLFFDINGYDYNTTATSLNLGNSSLSESREITNEQTEQNVNDILTAVGLMVNISAIHYNTFYDTQKIYVNQLETPNTETGLKIWDTIDEIKKDAESIKQKSTEIDQKAQEGINTLAGEITPLKTQANKHREQIKQLRQDTNQAQAQILGITTLQTATNSKVAELENGQRTHTGQIAELLQSTQEIKNQAQNTNAEFQTLKEAQQNEQDKQAQQAGQIEALENTVHNNTQTIASQRSYFDGEINKLKQQTPQIPANVLTENNLNSKQRSLSALTITPGNGTNNASLFLEKGNQKYEFFNDGNFGVWNNTTGTNVLRLTSNGQSFFYNNINLQGHKITNSKEPDNEQDLTNKKYVDDQVQEIRELTNSKIDQAQLQQALKDHTPSGGGNKTGGGIEYQKDTIQLPPSYNISDPSSSSIPIILKTSYDVKQLGNPKTFVNLDLHFHGIDDVFGDTSQKEESYFISLLPFLDNWKLETYVFLNNQYEKIDVTRGEITIQKTLSEKITITLTMTKDYVLTIEIKDASKFAVGKSWYAGIRAQKIK